MRDSIIQRLVDNCVISDSGCWLWTGFRNKKGYGCTSIGYVKELVHRIAWRLFRGDIPYRLCVLHQCDVPNCFNPDHLWLGTRADNNADMLRKGRKHFCRGSEISKKLTEAKVKRIKVALHTRTMMSVMQEFKISRTTVENIKRGLSWRHVK